MLGLWQDKSSYDHFMETIHDEIFEGSNQQESYKSISVDLFESILEMPGANQNLVEAIDLGRCLRVADCRVKTQLYLTDIELLNRAGTKPITHFDAARISIDPIATLMNRQFIPQRIMVKGFDLSVAQLENGAINISGFEIGAEEKNTTDNSELALWLYFRRIIY